MDTGGEKEPPIKALSKLIKDLRQNGREESMTGVSGHSQYGQYATEQIHQVVFHSLSTGQ